MEDWNSACKHSRAGGTSLGSAESHGLCALTLLLKAGVFLV